MNEEREKEELGELPEDLLRERGEIEVGDWPPYDPRRVPLDIEQQAKTERQQKDLPSGSMSQGAKVVSVFDTRPVNGEDFLFTDIQTITLEKPVPPNGGSGTPGTVGEFVTFSFRVPEGLIAVLRNFAMEVDLDVNAAGFSTLGSNQSAFIYRLKLNGVAQKGYDNVEAEKLQVDFPTHIIAGSSDSVEAVIATNVAPDNDIGPIRMLAKFYGILLLSTGRQKQYEIGEAKPSKTEIPRQPTASKPAPKRAPQQARRQRGIRASVTRPVGPGSRGARPARGSGRVRLGRNR